MKITVTVLLATYNGEKYISQLLDSLLHQTYSDFNVLIHDDGSKDKTMDIISEYVNSHPQKFKCLDVPSTGGVINNFSLLLNECESDYIMFCDQDDVWREEKIEKTLSAMKKAEEEFGNSTPLLVHGDMYVTDDKLNVISHSFFDFQKLDLRKPTFNHLLVQNCITGCSVMINKALKEKSGEIPSDCAMHDWWLGLVAVLFGEIIFIREPLLYYRQHGGNQVGAKNAASFGFVTAKLKNIKKIQENYLIGFVQARILRKRFGKELPADKLRILNEFCNMSELPKMRRIHIMRKYDLRKNTKLRVIGQYLLM